MSGYYRTDRAFSYFVDLSRPGWRPPQRGAVGRLLAHWSLSRQPEALVSLPTGSGKTAVALTAPHLVQAQRVLVVVPGRELRRQTAEAFRTQRVLREIGALSGPGDPVVWELTGRVSDWSALRDADVVVALPNAISPRFYLDSAQPPSDLFDLIVVDEAHHVPAATWRAILEHFDHEQGLLLTATPRRRDGRRLPGEHVYHYPLRQALDEGFYQPVRPVLLDRPSSAGRREVDELIAAQVVELAAMPEHATSIILVRASNRTRTAQVAAVYRELGLDVPVLDSTLRAPARDELIARLRAGQIRAVAVVHMLGEGFDLPNMRIVAYHDKHKSLPATIQLIGRLARVDSRFPQPSVLVAVRDTEVYPQLRGAATDLYKEDADWAEVLPGLIDDEIAQDTADRLYAQAFTPAPPMLSVESLQPVCRAVLYEIDADVAFQPGFLDGVVPDALAMGHALHGQSVLYSAVTPTGTTLVVATAAVARPRWHPTSPGLDAPTYELHLVTWLAAPQVGQPHLLVVNSADKAVINELLAALEAVAHVRIGDPRLLQAAFEALDRISVSSVGVRNTYQGGRGVPTYSIHAGSGVDRGLRDADTNHRALGHAMAQVRSDRGGSVTAGVSTGKGKYWESRYLPLRQYEQFVADLGARYRFPPPAASGPLLPGLARGLRLTEFPASDVAVIELDPALFGQGWLTAKNCSVDDLDLQCDLDQQRRPDRLPIIATDPSGTLVWRGFQDLLGGFHPGAVEARVRFGYATPIPFEELLTTRPPHVYFLDGQMVCGALVYRPTGPRNYLPPIDWVTIPWDRVDVISETKKKAATRGIGISIDEALEDYLRSRPTVARHRWILCNDGPGEIADYIVIEINPGLRVTVSLWHAKAAGGTSPSVRVEDLQVVTQQAVKSRRYLTDPNLWRIIGDRLVGKGSPAITVIEGNERLLRVLCGQDSCHPAWSIVRRAPVVTGRIGIAQPGLSSGQLRTELSTTRPSIAASQIREFLTVLHDATADLGELTLLVSE